MVLFAKTKFARDKHGQTLAGLVDFGVKSATKTQLHSVPTRARGRSLVRARAEFSFFLAHIPSDAR